MKGFLLDENLPSRLQSSPTLPVIAFSQVSRHPSDSDLWHYARRHELVIVSKDADFSDSCMLWPMPRANRYFVPGKCYHLTHRCHDRRFLLKFALDRDRYRQMVWQSLKCFAVEVLSDCLTSNHTHVKEECLAESLEAKNGIRN